MKKGIKVFMKTRELPEKLIVWQERKKMLWKEFLVIGAWKIWRSWYCGNSRNLQ